MIYSYTMERREASGKERSAGEKNNMEVRRGLWLFSAFFWNYVEHPVLFVVIHTNFHPIPILNHFFFFP